MKVSELKKDHCYLCRFQTGSGFHFDIIRYMAKTPGVRYAMHKFVLIKGFRFYNNSFAMRNAPYGDRYNLGSENVRKYVVPINQMLEKYLGLFIEDWDD